MRYNAAVCRFDLATFSTSAGRVFPRHLKDVSVNPKGRLFRWMTATPPEVYCYNLPSHRGYNGLQPQLLIVIYKAIYRGYTLPETSIGPEKWWDLVGRRIRLPIGAR